MDNTLAQRRTLALTLLVAAMTLALAVPHGTGTAQAAGSNMNQGTCVFAYNYADPDSGYLFASSEAFNDCHDVLVEIWNNGTVTSGSWGGFEGSYCYGSALWARNWGWGYVSASASVDASQWTHPCSFHYAENSWQGWPYSQGGLYFMCTHYGCML